MYKALNPWAIGVKAETLQDCVYLARRYGFEGCEFNVTQVADLIDAQGAPEAKKVFSDAGIKPAGWGLSVQWREDEAKYRKSLEAFPRLSKAAAAIGGTRCFTWIMPCSNERQFDANRRFHVDRFRPIAKILKENGCSLGLEFIGPKTLRESQKFPFIYKMEDMLAMAKDIGPNVGVLLDCWHWYTSGGIVADLHSLSAKQVVYVHVNDAPAGIALDKQIDNTRALPGETGVIDIKGFLKALDAIGYEGPVVAEPFKKELAEMGDDEARLKAVADSMDRIFSLAGI